jgi:hypothetical protein
MKILLYQAGDPNSHKEIGRKLQELKPGNYTIEIKKSRAVRSLSANRYYHAILNIIGIETGHTHEELHEALKLKFNSEVIFFPKGGSQMIGKSTAILDSAEFSGYVNRVRQWALDEFNIVIPESNGISQQQWMEIQNAYDENQQG